MSSSDSAASSDLVCSYPGCKSSGRVFKRSYELERHKLIHFPSKKLACPIQGCKHKKKGKTYTRDDKFREHIATHGELALCCCPIPDCKTVQVKITDFPSHVAGQHSILERYEIKPLLNCLRISWHVGHLACPMLCDFTATTTRQVLEHVGEHDLSERITFKSFFDLTNLDLSFGRATCPVCNLQVCGKVDYIDNLYLHLESSHADGMIYYGSQIARLLGPVWKPWRYVGCPVLVKIMRIFNPAQVASSILQPPISGSAAGEASSRSSESPKALENVLSVPNFGGQVDAMKPSSSSIVEIPTQQVWSPHYNNTPEGLFFPEIDVAGHSLPMRELSTSGQDMTAQPNIDRPQTSLEQQRVIPQQYFREPQSYIQPPGFITPPTSMRGSILSDTPVGSNFIPPCTCQCPNFWQPIANSHLNMGFDQYSHDGQLQWPLQSGMVRCGTGNQQQTMGLFVPSPENISYILPGMDFGESSNNATN
jgi:hypothetical protein